MPPPSNHPRHHLGRELSVKPRRTGYRHRPIIAVVDGVGVLETGELVTNLPVFAGSNDPHLWLTTDPVSLLDTMLDAFRGVPWFNYQVVETRDPDGSADLGITMSRARLTRFGFSKGRGKRAPGVRRRGMHVVWNPYDMSRAPDDFMDGQGVTDLLRFGADVRSFCQDNDIPLPTSLSGIAAALLTDKRFWPDARGRVPTATNDRVRGFLPGVYQELRAPVSESFDAVAIDQRSAYHRAAQEVATPDPTTLFARGYFTALDTAPVWAEPGTVLYERTAAQPGVAWVSYSAHTPRKHETYPPAIKPGVGRCALWTNELEYVQSQGVTIHGIIAAWTSCEPDAGIPLYGAWAAERIGEADAYRKRWLKPSLHALYGLLGMRVREVTMHYHRGKGEPGVVVLGRGRELHTITRALPGLPSPTTNVATLGVLQAEIRTRSFKMANALSMEGVEVLHIHADGLHVAGELPLLTSLWTLEPRTNLRYIDRVSWLSDQGHVLPGRDSDARRIYEQGKHLNDAATQARAYIDRFKSDPSIPF